MDSVVRPAPLRLGGEVYAGVPAQGRALLEHHQTQVFEAFLASRAVLNWRVVAGAS